MAVSKVSRHRTDLCLLMLTGFINFRTISKASAASNPQDLTSFFALYQNQWQSSNPDVVDAGAFISLAVKTNEGGDLI